MDLDLSAADFIRTGRKSWFRGGLRFDALNRRAGEKMRGSKKGPHAGCVSSLRARSKDTITAIRKTELMSSHVNSILMEGGPHPTGTVEDDGAVRQRKINGHWHN